MEAKTNGSKVGITRTSACSWARSFITEAAIKYTIQVLSILKFRPDSFYDRRWRLNLFHFLPFLHTLLTFTPHSSHFIFIFYYFYAYTETKVSSKNSDLIIQVYNILSCLFMEKKNLFDLLSLQIKICGETLHYKI